MSHRTQITLTDAQYAKLRAESERSGVGLAELVRRALAATYGTHPGRSASEALDASFGAWRGRGEDGERYVERMRHGLARRLSG
jgi:hypothetical protein